MLLSAFRVRMRIALKFLVDVSLLLGMQMKESSPKHSCPHANMKTCSFCSCEKQVKDNFSSICKTECIF